MKTKILLLLVFMATLQVQAQKIKLTDGDLKVLQGEMLIDIEFTYDENLKIGKLTEEEYMDKKMTEAEEGEPGAGEKWKAAWYEDRVIHFEPMFIELLNDNVSSKDVVVRPEMRNARLKMIVNTIFIEPGYNVGISRKNASIDLEIIIVPVDDDSKILAKVMLYDAPGRSMSMGDYDLGIRVGEGYAKAGKEFGKFLVKKKAF